MSGRFTHVRAVCDHRPRTGETIMLEDGSTVLVTRGMEPQPGWRFPPNSCRGVYAGVEGSRELLVSVRIPSYRA